MYGDGEIERAAVSDVTIVANDIGEVGGMERQLAELMLGLRARGHEVTVIARTCELPAALRRRLSPRQGAAQAVR